MNREEFEYQVMRAEQDRLEWEADQALRKLERQMHAPRRKVHFVNTGTFVIVLAFAYVIAVLGLVTLGAYCRGW